MASQTAAPAESAPTSAPANQVYTDEIVLPHSRTVSHILAYPMVDATVDYALNKNVVGRLNKNVTVWTFEKAGRPLVPVAKRVIDHIPYQYATPYAEKLDGFSETVLDKVDQYLPTQKTFGDVFDDTKSAAVTVIGLPYTVPAWYYNTMRRGGAQSQELSHHFVEEYKADLARIGSDNPTVLDRAKAGISASLRLMSEGLAAASEWVAQKRENVKATVANGAEAAAEAAAEAVQQGQEAVQEGTEKAQEAAQ